MERAASTDHDKVNAAMAASTYGDHFMPYGPTRFVDGQNTGAHPVCLQIQHADIKCILPDQYADAKPVFPRPKAS